MNAERTYEGRIELWTHDCRIAADRILVDLGLADSVVVRDHGRAWTYEVPTITAAQYDQVIDALYNAGEAGVDWNFPLD